MKITTGLEVKVDHLSIPLGTQKIAFQHPESDLPTMLGDIPESRVGALWVVYFTDRDSGRHQHMLVLSQEPKVEEKGLDLITVEDLTPDDYLASRLHREGVPGDAHMSITSDSLRGVREYKFRWFEVTV